MSGKRQLVLLGLAVIGAWVAGSAGHQRNTRTPRPRPGGPTRAERDRRLPARPVHGVALLPGYRTLGLFDGESRNWEGPEYRAATLGGTSTLDWQVTFDRPGSAAAMARKALGQQSWPVAEQPTVRIPHLVGTRNVGSIPAVALLTKAPGDNNAQYESVVAFPLCRGLFVAADFSLLTPGSEYATSPSDRFLISGTPTKQWNHDRAVEALGAGHARGLPAPRPCHGSSWWALGDRHGSRLPRRPDGRDRGPPASRQRHRRAGAGRGRRQLPPGCAGRRQLPGHGRAHGDR